jgi:hypothetical protein
MRREFRIVPECHIDTLITQSILNLKVNHAPSSGAVANTMKNNLVNKKALGIVDNDKKRVPNYFNEFELVEEKKGLELKKHKEKEHYLIVISPAADEWLYDAAIDLGIDLTTPPYKIKNFKSFLQLTKSHKVAEKQNIKDLLNTLKQKKGSPFHIFKNWVNEIVKID